MPMKNINILKPIKIFGGILIVASFSGIFMFYSFQADPEYDNSFDGFIIVMTIFYFMTGVGLLTQKSLGILFI